MNFDECNEGLLWPNSPFLFPVLSGEVFQLFCPFLSAFEASALINVKMVLLLN